MAAVGGFCPEALVRLTIWHFALIKVAVRQAGRTREQRGFKPDKNFAASHNTAPVTGSWPLAGSHSEKSILELFSTGITRAGTTHRWNGCAKGIPEELN